jgi:glutamyl-tRNA synthetase
LLRFAPSLTQDLDINSLKIALINYMVSINKNEDLIIRIEDSNTKDDSEQNIKKIIDILNLFSINYKHIVQQSSHIKYHSQFAMQLLIEKKAFNCFCSDEILQKEKDEAIKNNKKYNYTGFCQNLSDAVTFECEAPFTVRIKKPQKNIKFNDILSGEVEYTPEDIDSFIILNHDKTPTYNFACAIDDMLSDISTVIRDKKYQEETPRQIHVRNSIGYDKQLEYIHLDKIEDGNITIDFLINEGYLPIAITNYILQLSLDLPNDTEIFTLEDALKWFDISKISKDIAKFDIDKLKSINKAYIKDIDNLRLSKILGYSDSDIGALAKLYLEECDTISQLKAKIDAIFKDQKQSSSNTDEFEKVITCIKEAPFIQEFDKFTSYISKETNINEDALLKYLYIAFTNQTSGPDLNKIYPLIRNYLGEIIK